MIRLIKQSHNPVNFTVIFLFTNHIKNYTAEFNYHWLTSSCIKNFFVLFIIWYIGIALYFSAGSIITISSGYFTLQSAIKYYSIESWQNFLLFYTAAYWLIPVYFLKRKYFEFVCYSILLLVAYSVVGYLSNNTFYAVNFSFINGKANAGFSPWNFLGNQFMAGLQFIFIAASFRLVLDYFFKEKRDTILLKEKNEAELSFLRTQINPHVLFNALNNIYSLAQKKSDLAPHAILNLSIIMRHILYEKEDADQKVMLDSEIELLENFLDLQRLRFTDELFIDFIVSGKTAEKKIAPLLLLPFLENAFKHGVVNDPDIPLEIHLWAENERLHFMVRNKKRTNKEDNVPGGIGLKNVTKRLNLIYPDNHQLIIEEDEIIYKVLLIISFYD